MKNILKWIIAINITLFIAGIIYFIFTLPVEVIVMLPVLFILYGITYNIKQEIDKRWK